MYEQRSWEEIDLFYKKDYIYIGEYSNTYEGGEISNEDYALHIIDNNALILGLSTYPFFYQYILSYYYLKEIYI